MEAVYALPGHNQGPPLDPDERWDRKPRLEQSYACPKVYIRELLASGIVIPERYFEAIEQNQEREPSGALAVPACCRRIRAQGMIEAWYSSPADRDRRIPDIYVMTCMECGRLHRRFCVGGSIKSGTVPEYRPMWS